jgi:hypothetical protein
MPGTRIRFIGSTALALGCLVGGISEAKTLYVENWGGAGSPCTKAEPCSSIRHVLSSAGKNDRIVVGPGRYTSNTLVINHEGLRLESTAGRLARHSCPPVHPPMYCSSRSRRSESAGRVAGSHSPAPVVTFEQVYASMSLTRIHVSA